MHVAQKNIKQKRLKQTNASAPLTHYTTVTVRRSHGWIWWRVETTQRDRSLQIVDWSKSECR